MFRTFLSYDMVKTLYSYRLLQPNLWQFTIEYSKIRSPFMRLCWIFSPHLFHGPYRNLFTILHTFFIFLSNSQSKKLICSFMSNDRRQLKRETMHITSAPQGFYNVPYCIYCPRFTVAFSDMLFESSTSAI